MFNLYKELSVQPYNIYTQNLITKATKYKENSHREFLHYVLYWVTIDYWNSFKNATMRFVYFIAFQHQFHVS